MGSGQVSHTLTERGRDHEVIISASAAATIHQETRQAAEDLKNLVMPNVITAESFVPM
jgi:hypothetical protein